MNIDFATGLDLRQYLDACSSSLRMPKRRSCKNFIRWYASGSLDRLPKACSWSPKQALYENPELLIGKLLNI